jgi:predicted AAA+ superfamily ATPase
MKRFINREAIKIFKKRLHAPADEAQRQTLLKLLAEEEAKSLLPDRGEPDPKSKTRL